LRSSSSSAGARSAPRVRARHPLRCGAELFRERWFAIGMLVATVAWLLHVAADDACAAE